MEITTHWVFHIQHLCMPQCPYVVLSNFCYTHYPSNHLNILQAFLLSLMLHLPNEQHPPLNMFLNIELKDNQFILKQLWQRRVYYSSNITSYYTHQLWFYCGMLFRLWHSSTNLLHLYQHQCYSLSSWKMYPHPHHNQLSCSISFWIQTPRDDFQQQLTLWE